MYCFQILLSNSTCAATLRYYSPPVSARDFKQTVGDFTVSTFIPGGEKSGGGGGGGGGGRCVTGTKVGCCKLTPVLRRLVSAKQ
jgi:hypothetical protein